MTTQNGTVAVKGDVIEGATLAELAAIANREHAGVTEAAVTMVDHAIAAGEALLEARQKCEDGKWEDWCADNLGFSTRSAYTYLRLARYRDVLEGLDGPPVTSLNRARKLLVGRRDRGERKGPGDKFPPEMREAAKRLREEGMTYDAIGESLGVSRSTVASWIDPKRKEAVLARKKRDKANRAKRRQEAHDREVKAAARKATGGLAKAYSLAEQMQDALGLAERETTDSQTRQALASAGVSYRKMRDEIVTALGVSRGL